MDSTKDFKRTTLPFDTPLPISRRTKELVVNTIGHVRAEIAGGVVKVQTKKHKNQRREVILINTNVSPPTIELVMEDIEY
jgi:two-component sensor histidine kinase